MGLASLLPTSHQRHHQPGQPIKSCWNNTFINFAKSWLHRPLTPSTTSFFSPGYKDRIRFTKSARRGRSQRYWLQQLCEWILPVFQAHIDHAAPDHRRELLGLKQYLQLHPEYSLQLQTAPTRSPALFKRKTLPRGTADGQNPALPIIMNIP